MNWYTNIICKYNRDNIILRAGTVINPINHAKCITGI